MIGTADFSPCRRYRYGLTRRWAEGDAVLFLMLNPSVADETVLDPTVRRCVGFAKAWGFGALEVANLFALRSTDPDALYGCDDPVGPRNDHEIGRAIGRCSLTVVAWGVHGACRDRGRSVGRMLMSSLVGSVVCLGTTKDGHPRHPLYLRADSARVPYLATA